MKALLVLALAGCTLGGMGAGAGVVAVHNAQVDHTDEEWHYLWPVTIGAALGLGLDLILLDQLKKAWSKPMT